MGNAGEQLANSCITKLKRYIPKEVQVKFVVTCNTTKLSFFTNMKAPTTKLASSFTVYHFCCPWCYHNCIGKKKRKLWRRINKHGYHIKDSMINKHITNCKGVNHLVDLVNFNYNSVECEKFDRKSFGI